MKCALFYIFLFSSLTAFCQNVADTIAKDTLFEGVIPVTNTFVDTPGQTSFLKKNRVKLIAGIHVGAYTGTLFLLSEAWYKNQERTPFHTFNDTKEWLQVDKAGHAWTAYNIAKYSNNLWLWAGVPTKKAVWFGGISSIGYQTILEYLDGHSEKWGWSWADMGANVFGSSLYVAQQLKWKDQRIQLKFSSHRINYNDDLERRANDLFGRSVQERILKDYNGQSYWLSANVGSFLPKVTVPAWLNIAVGYGAKGVWGGFENKGYNKDGSLIFDRTDIKRQRQWYLSPDVDFTKIHTNKKGVKTVFSLLNMIKFPAPSLELSGGKLKGHVVFF